MRVAVGLVVQGGKEFIEKWISCVEKFADCILVVDNGADSRVRDLLINHPLVNQYRMQREKGRNMSRDYQQILEMAREEDCQWVLNLDIDEYMPLINKDALFDFLLNCTDHAIGFPLFEMRGDKEHYVMVGDRFDELKDGRLVHKMYQTLSHLEFNQRDIHGRSIPHNCNVVKEYITVPIMHFGHMTKEMRDAKRKKTGEIKDNAEFEATWMQEDESKIVIKEWQPLLEDIKSKHLRRCDPTRQQ